MDQLYHQLREENEDLQRALATLEKHLETTIGTLHLLTNNL